MVTIFNEDGELFYISLGKYLVWFHGGVNIARKVDSEVAWEAARREQNQKQFQLSVIPSSPSFRMFQVQTQVPKFNISAHASNVEAYLLGSQFYFLFFLILSFSR